MRPSGNEVLELVWYITDIEIKRWKSKLHGRELKKPVIELLMEKGTPHYVFVKRSFRPCPSNSGLGIPPGLVMTAALTRGQAAAAATGKANESNTTSTPTKNQGNGGGDQGRE